MEKISGLSKIRMELTRFIEMFGDPVQNPMGWRKKLLSETAVIITGNTPSRADKNNYGTYLEQLFQSHLYRSISGDVLCIAMI